MTDLSSDAIAAAIAATPPQEPRSIHAETAAIITITAQHFGIRESALLGSGLHHRLVDARSVAIALVRARTGLSWPLIGEAFKRDHSTCMNAAERVMASPERLAWAAAVQAELDREDP